MKTYHGVAELEASIGEELGPTDWMTIDQARINDFADATDDHQWIHVDPERAAAGPFGATVAHGFLTLSLLPHLTSGLRRIEGARMGINYGLNKVRFPAPVRVGSRIRARGTTISVEPVAGGAVQMVTQVVIDVEGTDKPACVADMVSRHYFDVPGSGGLA